MVDDKWLAALDTAIHGEMDRVSQQLTQRVKELAERYETPMPQMVGRVAELEAKVNGHLEKMGFAWKVKPGYKQTEVGVIPEDWPVTHSWQPIADDLLRIASSVRRLWWTRGLRGH